MRILLALVAFGLVATPATAADPGSRSTGEGSANCRPSGIHLAEQNGKNLRVRKLAELPKATAYMAVQRTVGGCDAPLTMVEYRRPPRR